MFFDGITAEILSPGSTDVTKLITKIISSKWLLYSVPSGITDQSAYLRCTAFFDLNCIASTKQSHFESRNGKEMTN